ncbi:kinase-like domain-containing protein [Sporodiniella umbellata]|nr:kinase-like domain-containing protein [Sporodiniella umbellata]
MTRLATVDEVYDVIEQIGDGSFGTVHKGRHKISQKIVAVKVMKKKYANINDCEDQFEPKLLHLMPSHINIVQMYDSCLSNNGDLSFIMEFMNGGNLYQLMRERKQQHLPLSHCELQSILHQVLSALSHVHLHNVFHRDMKPENLLIDYTTGKPIIKLADFGLARETKSRPPYTEYVSTRWYRAPEVLLRSTEYSSAVDLWAIGTIFAELITLEPLFPGDSEVDQIRLICEILGSPGNRMMPTQKKNTRTVEKRPSPGFARKKKPVEPVETIVTNSTLSVLDGGGEWKEGVKLAYKIGFQFPNSQPKPLETVIPGASDCMLDLLRQFLLFNPSYRWTADKALEHPFFLETSEPVHNVIRMNFEPITPPESTANLPLDRELYSSKSHASIITPLDLLPIPTSPHPICPEWADDPWNSDPWGNQDHSPRLASRSGSITTHVDRFVHDLEPPSSPDSWIAETRPIYSSHQKVHPVTDVPLHNKYLYASHQKQRLDTPAQEKKKKRMSIDDVYKHETVNTLSVSHTHPHHHRPFSREHHGAFGQQMIKWTPPLIYQAESKRPPSRRQKTIVPSSQHSSRRDSRGHHRMNLWVPSDEEEGDDPKQDPVDDLAFLQLQ